MIHVYVSFYIIIFVSYPRVYKLNQKDMTTELVIDMSRI